MKSSVLHARIKECQRSKLNELQAELKTEDDSQTIRACIDIAYNVVAEHEKYLINFYNIKKSRLYKWVKEQEDA